MPSSARPRMVAVAKYGLADGSTTLTSRLPPYGLPGPPRRSAGLLLDSQCPSRRRRRPNFQVAVATRTQSTHTASLAPLAALAVILRPRFHPCSSCREYPLLRRTAGRLSWSV